MAERRRRAAGDDEDDSWMHADVHGGAPPPPPPRPQAAPQERRGGGRRAGAEPAAAAAGRGAGSGHDEEEEEGGDGEDVDALLGLLGKGEGGEDDDEEDEAAPASDVALLKVAWLNEVHSPELQFFEEDVVNAVRADLERQQEEVDARPADTELNFVYNLYQQEIDRVKFVLTSYLRTRLRKIQRHAIYTLADEATFQRLSAAEQEFAKGYVDMVERHFNVSFLNGLPERFRDIAAEGMVPRPQLDAHVVVRVNETLGKFEVAPDVYEELRQGDVLFVSYRPFRALLAEGKVDLM